MPSSHLQRTSIVELQRELQLPRRVAGRSRGYYAEGVVLQVELASRALSCNLDQALQVGADV